MHHGSLPAQANGPVITVTQAVTSAVPLGPHCQAAAWGSAGILFERAGATGPTERRQRLIRYGDVAAKLENPKTLLLPATRLKKPIPGFPEAKVES